LIPLWIGGQQPDRQGATSQLLAKNNLKKNQQQSRATINNKKITGLKSVDCDKILM
jgi:hypothetical protein